MQTNRASRTAEFMALFRALESARPEAEHLFRDPFAGDFLSRPLRRVVGLAGRPFARRVVERFIDGLWPGARSSAVARTRLIDDALAAARAEGDVERVVILGAGFDTRFHRLDFLRSLEVIEVDHPSTQRVKRAALASRAAGCTAPLYLGVDFDRDSLEAAWTSAGFDRTRGAVFVWEGVTNYLTTEAVDAVLRFVRSAGTRNTLIFTYVDRRAIDDPRRYRGSTLLRWTLRRAGERWTFGIDPRQLPAFLGERGFELVSDLGASEYRARYRMDDARGYEFYHVAVARAV